MLKQVTVLLSMDLSNIGIETREFEGALFFDENDQPVELEVHLAGLTSDHLAMALNGRADDILGGRTVRMHLPAGTEINATIVIVKTANFNSDGAVAARCLIASAHSGMISQSLPGTWRFRLTNVKLQRFDRYTETPAPPELRPHLHGCKLDKMTWTILGREWTLKDEMCGKWSKQRECDVHVPLVSASLSTPVQPNDTPDSICEIGDRLAAILTLALSRSVRAVRIERIDVAGECSWWHARNLMAFPFSRSGFPAVDNFEVGTLRGFVERAYPIVVAKHDWWMQTIELLMQVHANSCIETKTMLLNVLADRIASEFVRRADDSEIDAQFNARIETGDFRKSLHQLLIQASENWTEDRTAALIAMMKEWNSKPSFSEGIRRACLSLGIRPPTGKLLRTRHGLMHAGKLPTRGMSPSDYWKEMDAVVILLLLRMLNYDDRAYVAKFGTQERLLRDYLDSA